MTPVSDLDALSVAGEAKAAVVASDVRVTQVSTGHSVIEDVSLSIKTGEVVGLVGESGCGKTTLSLALLGHARRGLRISGGKVVLGDRDVLAMSPRELGAARGSLMAYVPQDPSGALNPALRVQSQLRERVGLAGSAADADAAVAAALEEVQLPATARTLNAFPHQLSGGQQQRVAIAMAFLNRPRLIVMDEPTTGLDVTTQARVLATVRQLCRQHAVAVLYVSHDLAVVGSLADRVLVMYAGRTAETGTTTDVLTTPRHPYVRGLLDAVPSLDKHSRLVGIAGQAPDPAQRPLGCAFEPRCAYSIQTCLKPPPRVEVAPGHEAWCVRASGGLRLVMAEREAGVEQRPQVEAALLSIRQLYAWHGNSEILHSVSLDVAPGSCVALVGESGSGKTTFARCVAGIHTLHRGEIRLAGSQLAKTARERTASQRSAVQYIFQNPYASLNPRRVIIETLKQPLLEISKLDRREIEERAEAALDQVALSRSTALRYPHELSGGQRQRVAIARALVVEPLVLVCDEITSALDVSVQGVVAELLERLRVERNLALLFVTHNLALVRSVAQEVAVMDHGAIVERGAVHDLVNSPRTPTTTRLLTDVPRMPNSARTMSSTSGQP